MDEESTGKSIGGLFLVILSTVGLMVAIFLYRLFENSGSMLDPINARAGALYGIVLLFFLVLLLIGVGMSLAGVIQKERSSVCGVIALTVSITFVTTWAFLFLIGKLGG